MDKLRVLYDCLEVPQEERSSLCIKEASSLEELCKVDKVSAIREEVAKWQAVKKENMATILGRSKAEIEAIWRYRMVGARTQQAFSAALSSTRLPRPDVGGFDNECLTQCRLIAF